MSSIFPRFGELATELQEAIWEQDVGRPNVHFLSVRPNNPHYPGTDSTIPPSVGSSWVISNPFVDEQQLGWFSPANPSAYSRLNQVRNVSTAARAYVDGLLRRGSVNLRLTTATSTPAAPIVVNPVEDLIVVQLNLPYFRKWTHWLVPDTFWLLPNSLQPDPDRAPLHHDVLGSIFPAFQQVRNLGIPMEASHYQEFQGWAAQDWHIAMIKLISRYCYESLFLPCHFHNLETVYIVDETITLHPGLKPLAQAPRFHGNGVEYAEVLDVDPAWNVSALSRWWFQYYLKKHIRTIDAGRWAAGQPSAITHGSGISGLAAGPSHISMREDAPAFWHDARELGVRRPFHVKLLARVVFVSTGRPGST